MAKLRYSWNKVVAGDIISFNYNKKRRTVLVISPKYVLQKLDDSKVELMSGLQLETKDNRAAPKILTILKQLGSIQLVDEQNEIYRVNFDGRKLDADKRKLSSSIKLLVANKNDLYRTYDYKKMRKESPTVFLDDLESLPRRLLKEAAK
jgi:hypothetical protein|tara:strand:- start:316 stop:762 length:447 start_codon:yes stop_codon:yes gene_type:complete